MNKIELFIVMHALTFGISLLRFFFEILKLVFSGKWQWCINSITSHLYLACSSLIILFLTVLIVRRKYKNQNIEVQKDSHSMTFWGGISSFFGFGGTLFVVASVITPTFDYLLDEFRGWNFYVKLFCVGLVLLMITFLAEIFDSNNQRNKKVESSGEKEKQV